MNKQPKAKERKKETGSKRRGRGVRRESKTLRSIMHTSSTDSDATAASEYYRRLRKKVRKKERKKKHFVPLFSSNFDAKVG